MDDFLNMKTRSKVRGLSIMNIRGEMMGVWMNAVGSEEGEKGPLQERFWW